MRQTSGGAPFTRTLRRRTVSWKRSAKIFSIIIFIDHLTEEGDHDFSNSDDSLKAKLTHILYHLKTDRIRFRKMFSSESAELFWDYFKDCFQDKFKDEMRNLMQDKKSLVLEKFADTFTSRPLGDRKMVACVRFKGVPGDDRSVL